MNTNNINHFSKFNLKMNDLKNLYFYNPSKFFHNHPVSKLDKILRKMNEKKIILPSPEDNLKEILKANKKNKLEFIKLLELKKSSIFSKKLVLKPVGKKLDSPELNNSSAFSSSNTSYKMKQPSSTVVSNNLNNLNTRALNHTTETDNQYLQLSIYKNSLLKKLLNNEFYCSQHLEEAGSLPHPHPHPHSAPYPPPPAAPLKKRRAKRTEEERIAYLRSDPYVAQFEAYRALCASCNKWIRLRPNSTYCSIPWDAHRKSCLGKRA